MGSGHRGHTQVCDRQFEVAHVEHLCAHVLAASGSDPVQLVSVPLPGRCALLDSIDPVAIVRRRGVVLQSARGPSPSLAELVAGAPIRGSWWGHPRNHEIFDAINRARSSSAIVATPLVRGKVTLVHRRLWPPLVRLADRFDVGALDVLHEEHSASGAHRVTRTAFPGWVPSDVMVSAQALSEEEALTQLPEWLRDVVVGISRPK